MWYIRYRVQGEVFGVQTSHLEMALSTIKQYVCFNEIISIEKRDRYSLAASSLYL